VRSRKFVQSDSPDGPSEIEADKIIKRRFLRAIGEGFEKEMVFFTKKLKDSHCIGQVWGVNS